MHLLGGVEAPRDVLKGMLRVREREDGKVLVPEGVANVAWGGEKYNRLYICATTSLYAILLPVRGTKTM